MHAVAALLPLQAPAPLQSDPCTVLLGAPPTQVVAPHVVLLEDFWHDPALSHVPLVPHGFVLRSSTQRLRGLLSILAGPHEPSVPCCFNVALHAMHVPVHAFSQQIPSAHTPVVQPAPPAAGQV